MAKPLLVSSIYEFEPKGLFVQRDELQLGALIFGRGLVDMIYHDYGDRTLAGFKHQAQLFL